MTEIDEPWAAEEATPEQTWEMLRVRITVLNEPVAPSRGLAGELRRSRWF